MQKIEAVDYVLMDEAQLARRASHGDRGAFREVMRRCNQRLFRVARAIVRDDSEAEDVLQEAYTCAFAAIASFRGDASLATWLTRIVLNEAHGRLRRRRPTVGLDALDVHLERNQVLPFPGASSDDPEADAARAQIRRLLERAVDGLPEPFRLVFILREVEGLTSEQTAAHLGLRPETVKTRLHRARSRLREALETQVADVMTGVYPFLGTRCARITAVVLERMGPVSTDGHVEPGPLQAPQTHLMRNIPPAGRMNED
jgi:RNA polymerase sigma-70 factor (ECF subfamily)